MTTTVCCTNCDGSGTVDVDYLDDEPEDTRTPGEIEDQDRENKGCYQCHQLRDEP